MRPTLRALASLALLLPTRAVAQPATGAAVRALQAVLTAEAAFDAPAAAAHYADDAEIRLLVHGAGSGHVQTVILTGAEYKEAMRGAMPVARRRGDRNRYTGFAADTKADTVRVTATRHNALKQYDGPVAFQLVERGGRWWIVGMVAQVVP